MHSNSYSEQYEIRHKIEKRYATSTSPLNYSKSGTRLAHIAVICQQTA